MPEICLAVNGPGVVGESVDGEALIVNLETGCYYSARGTADAIWALIAAESPSASIVEAMRVRFPADDSDLVTSQTLAFIDELLAEGLAIQRESRMAPSAPSAAAIGPASWVTPVLEKFTDMQALLLLDPIHEVDETGWPQPAWPTAPADPRGLT